MKKQDVIICNNTYHTLNFIPLQGSWDQPSAQEFTKYIGQASPALFLNQRGCGCSNSTVVAAATIA